MFLTLQGIALAKDGRLSDAERGLVYQDDPYAAFIARQFQEDDVDLYEYLRDSILAPIGVDVLDGQVDGLDSFRGEIIRKIRRARFFICLLTHRHALADGSYASSVWLYQETGAAVALGKKPLILVERGMHEHYAGELQKTYEYLSFDRSDYKDRFSEVARRLQADRRANHIRLPDAAT